MSPDPCSPDLLAQIATDAEDLDRGLRGPACEVAALREHGWLQAALPAEYGGHDWGFGSRGARIGFAALFMLASVSLPITRIFEGHVNAVRLINRFGTEAQRANLFAQVRAGALLAIWGADGPAPVTIEACGQSPKLRGVKAFASGLGEVAHAIVTAADEQGACQMVIAPGGDPARWRLSAWDVAAMVGTCSGEFIVEGLDAGQANLLGKPGALFAEPDFNGGIWRLCAAYAGAMAAIAQFAVAHAEQRGADDDPLMRSRMGQVQANAQTALLWAWHACRALEVSDGPRRTDRSLAASLFAREAIEHAASEQMTLVERMIGTAGHRRGSRLGRTMRDLRFFLRQAALDAKLDTAVSLYTGEPRLLMADFLDGEDLRQPVMSAF